MNCVSKNESNISILLLNAIKQTDLIESMGIGPSIVIGRFCQSNIVFFCPKMNQTINIAIEQTEGRQLTCQQFQFLTKTKIVSVIHPKMQKSQKLRYYQHYTYPIKFRKFSPCHN